MIPVHHYQIEVDVDGFYKTEGGLYLDRIGSDADKHPLHGVITHTPINAKFKEGDEAYYNHFLVKNLVKDKDGRYTLTLKESDIMAVKRGDEWIDGVMRPAKKIKREQKKSSIFVEQDNEYYLQKFELDGDIVWVYKSSPYAPPYLEDYTFLRPEYLVYNETKDECLNDFIVMQLYDDKDEYKKTDSGILLPTKIVKQKGKAKVVKPNKYGIKGDVVFLKSKNNGLEHTEDLFAVRLQYLLGCYETN